MNLKKGAYTDEKTATSDRVVSRFEREKEDVARVDSRNGRDDSRVTF
jgi:hypothetical protein